MATNALIAFSIFTAVLGMGLAGACFALVASQRSLEERVRATLSDMEQDQRMLGLVVKDSDGRLARLELRARTLKDAQHQLESRATGGANYGQAISLVQRGWRMEDLVSTCGLTHGEAELVYMLHGPGGALKGGSYDMEVNN